jgi:hypothetical protein
MELVEPVVAARRKTVQEEHCSFGRDGARCRVGVRVGVPRGERGEMCVSWKCDLCHN